MLGVLIALVIAGCKVLATHNSVLAFLSATHFLFWWCVIMTGVAGVLYLIIFLVVTLGGTVFGAKAGEEMTETVKGKIIGAILGFAGGGALSVILLIRFVIVRALLISGSYLLYHSVVMTGGTPEWNIAKVVWGAILLVIGLIINKSSGSSSSSSSSSSSN